MAFTKDSIKQLLATLRPVLEQLASSNGAALKVGTMRWDASLAKMTIEFHALSAGGEDIAAQREFELYSYGYGMKPEDFGREFAASHTRYRIVGVKPRSRQPIICLDLNTGGRYKFAPEAVAALLATQSKQ